jgi:hypothetical protein
MIQACRLRESGWSIQGLATLFDVSFTSIENWLCKRPLDTTIRRPGGALPKIEDRVEEAIALIRMGYWPLKQRSEVQVKSRRRAAMESYWRRRASVPPRPVPPVSQVWEPVLLPMLESDPTLRATDLIKHLQETRPEHDWGSKKLFNALRARVRRWKMPEDQRKRVRRIWSEQKMDRRRARASRPEAEPG